MAGEIAPDYFDPLGVDPEQAQPLSTLGLLNIHLLRC